MITIQNAIEQIVTRDIDARIALERGYMNYSKYARLIQKEVEELSKKKVTRESIVITLSRMKKAKATAGLNSIPETIEIKNITTKSPLTELSYQKTPQILTRLEDFFTTIKPENDDFLVLTYSTGDITITASNRLIPAIKKYFKQKPTLDKPGLAALSLSIQTHYYDSPGVTYTFLKRIAAQNITLAETITSYNEITFTFEQKHLGTIVELFS